MQFQLGPLEKDSGRAVKIEAKGNTGTLKLTVMVGKSTQYADLSRHEALLLASALESGAALLHRA